MTTPTIVKAPSTADLLALLPDLAGVPVANSIVVAPFTGRYSGRAMRIDLPPESSPEVWRGLASAFLGPLARLNGCDGVALALYTDDPYDATMQRWREGLDHIMSRLHGSGYHIKDAAVQASDGWGSFFDDDAPRPLAEVESSQARFPEGSRERSPRELPDTDPALADQVRERTAALLSDEAALPDPIAFVEKCLADHPEYADATRLAQLIALIQTEGAVDRTVLQIAFGRKAGSRSWARTLDVRARAHASDTTPMDVLHQDYARGLITPSNDRLGNMLMGQSGAPISPERLRSGAVLLGRAIAHCPVPQRSWAMCALGWLRWALGLTSAANEILLEAHRVDEQNTLPPVYLTLIHHFSPEWIYRDQPPAAPNRAARRTSARRRGR